MRIKVIASTAHSQYIDRGKNYVRSAMMQKGHPLYPHWYTYRTYSRDGVRCYGMEAVIGDYAVVNACYSLHEVSS